ncbi:MAG TPA: phosphotransferase [Symbiobacteriaceae bacterium]|jgi:aminoglycoside phosphotransferase (APT) family kinase protein
MMVLAERELGREHPEWEIRGLRAIGGGLEFVVYRAESAFGPVAVRVPRLRVYANDNDACVSARDLLRQEAFISGQMALCGVPVPRVFGLHLSPALDCLVSAFVESDGSAPDPRALGRMTAAIHAAPVPEFVPVGQGVPGLTDSLAETLAERLVRRTQAVERLAGVKLELPGLADLRAVFAWPAARRSILHMDFRPANLLTHQGEIRAVIDWSNALIGDPTLELARIAEYGHLDQAFRAGYGSQTPFAHLPPGLEELYRLDTATMLAVVFLSEAPDPAQAAKQVRRVAELQASLARAL